MRELCEQTNIILNLKGGVSKHPTQSIWLNPKDKTSEMGATRKEAEEFAKEFG